MIDDVLSTCQSRMKQAVDALRQELGGIRTGRASASLVEHLRVDYHGVPTPLHQMASIGVPEARLITIQPWDRSVVGAVEKAILKSDLGIIPQVDGALVRLVIPPLTEDRRRDMVKMVRRKVEEGRVEVRNVRRDGIEELRRLLRNKEVGEDEEHRAQDVLQKYTDQFTAEAEKVGQEKEKDLIAT